MLSDEDVATADQIVALLSPLPMSRGISILISILAATLNGWAQDDADRRMLADAVGGDLHTTMMKGSRGVLTTADPINLQGSGPAPVEER